MRLSLPVYIRLFFVVSLVALVTGCGGSSLPLGKVKGKVTANGLPVKGGTVSFAPAEGTVGQAASGVVKEDGTYVLTTVKEGDGASIGKNFITYSPPTVQWNPPDWDGKGEEPKAPKSEYDGLKPKEYQTDVAAGENTVDIELVPGSSS